MLDEERDVARPAAEIALGATEQPIELVLRRGMKSAAFGATAIFDRHAAEDFGKPLEGAIIPRIDEPVSA